ncbi:MAG TPA: anti-sigma factor, partial [Gaiellaceae bacterium]|nr:anti-sigma factor [Gaiellaceae bacterium]
ALALGVRALQLSDELEETRAALAVLGDPAAREVALAAGRGRLVVAPDGRAVLLVAGLAPAPPGKTYELWVIENGRPSPAGLFEGGAPLVLVEGTVDDGDVVAVTIEEAGGAEQPTTKPVVASNPV